MLNEEKNTRDVQEYRQWLKEQFALQKKIYSWKEAEDGNFILENDLGTASINFYLQDLVEIMITTKVDNAMKYYLHFELNDPAHARYLFQEMIDALQNLSDTPKVKVLLCCTSGATTGYFAMLLNDAAKTLNLEYEFDAVPYWKLYEVAPEFDIILTAPQIGYKYKKIVNSLPKKLVLQAPTALFANNDSYQTLQYLDGALQNFKQAKAKRKQVRCACSVAKDKKPKILVITVITGSEHYRTYYRVYEDGNILLDETTVKPRKYQIAFKDIVDSVKVRFPDIQMVLYALPGVSENHSVWHLIHTPWAENLRIKEVIESACQVPTWIMNNSNAAAIGFASEHPEYHNVVFHSQPYGLPTGGQGIIINDQLLTGRNGMVGELYPFIERMQFSQDPQQLSKTDEGMLELVTKSLLPTISLLGPEAIALRSPMTSDMNEVRAKLQSFLNPEYIPDLFYVEDMSKYMLEGARLQAEKWLEQPPV